MRYTVRWETPSGDDLTVADNHLGSHSRGSRVVCTAPPNGVRNRSDAIKVAGSIWSLPAVLVPAWRAGAVAYMTEN